MRSPEKKEVMKDSGSAPNPVITVTLLVKNFENCLGTVISWTLSVNGPISSDDDFAEVDSL